jgi:hypothetical protein
LFSNVYLTGLGVFIVCCKPGKEGAMAEEKMTCLHCPGEMVLQTFTNCFQQSIEFFRCAGCGFTLDRNAVGKPKDRKVKARFPKGRVYLDGKKEGTRLQSRH